MPDSKEQQQFFMQWAIRLGEQGRCSAPPNPWVGCVIVKDGEMIGEGYHESPGQPHAEIMALYKAKELARGATAYVTLEPCAHQGRTPPCASSLIQAGLKKVVIALIDPDSQVQGKGVEALRNAGIEVEVGVCEEEAAQSLLPYLTHRRTQLPYCCAKTAMSLDGKIAAGDGTSKWITGEEARKNAHQLRAESQAILVGAGTAALDRPQLTVREIPVKRQPLRVLLDPKGRVPAEGPLFEKKLASTLIFTTQECPVDRLEAWKKTGAEVLYYEKLKDILVELGKRGVLQLLIEGGGQTHAAFLKEKLIDRFSIYVGGCLLGQTGKPLLPGIEIATIEETPRLHLEKIYHFGNDLRLDYTF